MNNAFKPNFVTLEFLEDTFYKGSLRIAGEKFDVDGSYAKNFIAQGKAVVAEGDSSDEIKSNLDAL